MRRFLSSHSFKFSPGVNRPSVKAKLIGGNFEFIAKENLLSASVSTDDGSEGDLVCTGNGSDCVISGQKLKTFFPQKERIGYKIHVPAGSDLDINCFAGSVRVEGNYSSLRANVNIGEIVTSLQDMHEVKTPHSVHLDILIGSIEVGIPSGDTVVESKNNTMMGKDILVNNTLKYECRLLLGGLDIIGGGGKLPFRRK